jgi:hypothetical protein
MKYRSGKQNAIMATHQEAANIEERRKKQRGSEVKEQRKRVR